MSKLPSGWARTTLGTVADWGAGGTPSRSQPNFYGGKIPWIKSGELNSRYIKTTEESITEEAIKSSSAKIFPAGSVAIAMYGATIGKTAILGVDASTNQACAVGVPVEGLIGKEYLYRLLQNEKAAFIEKGKGGAQPNISQAVIKAHEIGLPPLAEQTRIAVKLDELLAQVDNLKARVDGIPALLKRFRQSVLAAAVSGRLTEEWRKENLIRYNWIDKTVKASVEAERAALGFKPIKVSESRNANRTEAPSSWVWLKLSETALKITDGAHNTPKTLEQGFPYITAKNLTGGVLDFTDRKFIAEKEHRELYKKCAPAIGDLLIVNIGAGTGNSATVTVDFEFSFKNIAIIKRPKIINPQYLKIFFDARKKTIFNEQTQGGAQPFLSLTMLGNIEIVLPPSEEQTEIVRQVEQLFAFADQLETRVKSIQARIDNLTQSVLAKAFCGELVSQDPNDESASVLLERIKAQRAAAPKAKRGRRSATAGLASHPE